MMASDSSSSRQPIQLPGSSVMSESFQQSPADESEDIERAKSGVSGQVYFASIASRHLSASPSPSLPELRTVDDKETIVRG